MWQSFIQSDGIHQALTLLLLLMSVASWVVIVWKWRLLHQTRQQWALAQATFWQAPSLAEANDRLSNFKSLWPLSQATIAVAAIKKEASATSTTALTLHQQTSTEQRLTRLLREALRQVQQPLHWGQTLLATIGSTAPFVGLLGTVWGIHHALIRIGAENSITLEQVAGPVGEALVMTAAGLAVALPAVVAYNLLGRSAAQLETQFEAFAHDLRALVLETVTQ
jgi:biopolymer transport protein ExbB